MNDTTSGSAPVLPPEAPRDPARGVGRGHGTSLRSWLAGGAAALVVAGLGGLWVGQAATPEGDGLPAYVHQDGQQGPQQGQDQQAPGVGEGSDT